MDVRIINDALGRRSWQLLPLTTIHRFYISVNLTNYETVEFQAFPGYLLIHNRNHQSHPMGQYTAWWMVLFEGQGLKKE